MKLVRSVPVRVRPGISLLNVAFGVALLGVPLGLVAVSRAPRFACGPSKERVANLHVKKLAFDAYPAWHAIHPERLCPDDLGELAPFSDSDRTTDPWGGELRFLCDRQGIAIWSAGEDGRFGSGDDITSRW